MAILWLSCGHLGSWKHTFTQIHTRIHVYTDTHTDTYTCTHSGNSWQCIHIHTCQLMCSRSSSSNKNRRSTNRNKIGTMSISHAHSKGVLQYQGVLQANGIFLHCFWLKFIATSKLCVGLSWFSLGLVLDLLGLPWQLPNFLWGSLCSLLGLSWFSLGLVLGRLSWSLSWFFLGLVLGRLSWPSSALLSSLGLSCVLRAANVHAFMLGALKSLKLFRPPRSTRARTSPAPDL